MGRAAPVRVRLSGPSGRIIRIRDVMHMINEKEEDIKCATVTCSSQNATMPAPSNVSLTKPSTAPRLFLQSIYKPVISRRPGDMSVGTGVV